MRDANLQKKEDALHNPIILTEVASQGYKKTAVITQELSQLSQHFPVASQCSPKYPASSSYHELSRFLGKTKGFHGHPSVSI